MCTFNGETFLRSQLESILSQRRLPDELWICDDRSSDNSADIANGFARRAPFPVHVIVNETTLRSTKNFEKAISLCRGTVVALADQDDVWYSHKLERIEQAFLQQSAPIAAFSDADLIDENSRMMGVRLWGTFSFDRGKQREFESGHALKVLLKHPVVTGATLAFRKDFFDLVTPIPSNDIHDRWISFLLAARGRFEIIPEPLMQYRRHSAQQEGVPALNVRDRIEVAQNRSSSVYLEEIVRLQQLQDRLQVRRADFSMGDEALSGIKKKIVHLRHRAQLPRAKLARIPVILQDAWKGDYWRYSGGWVSIAKDLAF